MLTVLPLVPSGEPAGTRTQGPRLKSTDISDINQHDDSFELSDE